MTSRPGYNPYWPNHATDGHLQIEGYRPEPPKEWMKPCLICGARRDPHECTMPTKGSKR
jgi:hypothetical protein